PCLYTLILVHAEHMTRFAMKAAGVPATIKRCYTQQSESANRMLKSATGERQGIHVFMQRTFHDVVRPQATKAAQALSNQGPWARRLAATPSAKPSVSHSRPPCSKQISDKVDLIALPCWICLGAVPCTIDGTCQPPRKR